MLSLRHLCGIGLVISQLLLLSACGGDEESIASSSGSSSSSSNSSSSNSSSSSSSSSGSSGGSSGGSGSASSSSSSSSSGSSSGAGSKFCKDNYICKIMPLGDAITDGLGMTGGGGYRVEMFRLALESGMDFTFVGSQHNGPTHISGISFPNSHEGHLGATIQQIDLMIQKNTLLVDPNIILLHIGTNDMFQNPTGAAARLGVFMDNITARVPDALLVVSNIIPFPAVANAVNQYNSEIPHLVEQRRLRGKNVMFVDQFSGFPPSQMPDGVYPNAQGYARMGQIWFNAIYEHLVDLD